MFTGNDENDLFSEEGTKKDKKMPHCRILERSGRTNVKQLETDICLHGMYILWLQTLKFLFDKCIWSSCKCLVGYVRARSDSLITNCGELAQDGFDEIDLDDEVSMPRDDDDNDDNKDETDDADRTLTNFSTSSYRSAQSSEALRTHNAEDGGEINEHVNYNCEILYEHILCCYANF